MIVCNTCFEERDESQFFYDKRRSRHVPTCRECDKARRTLKRETRAEFAGVPEPESAPEQRRVDPSQGGCPCCSMLPCIIDYFSDGFVSDC